MENFMHHGEFHAPLGDQIQWFTHRHFQREFALEVTCHYVYRPPHSSLQAALFVFTKGVMEGLYSF